MKHLLTLAVLLTSSILMGMGMTPQLKMHNRHSTPIKLKAEKAANVKDMVYEDYNIEKRHNTPAKESATTHTVTCKFVYDEEAYESRDEFRVLGEDGFYQVVDTWMNEDSNIGTIELPEGTYLFYTIFDIRDSSMLFSNGGYAWIVLENIVVTEDIEIDFIAADAKNNISLKGMVTPHGDVPMLETKYFTPESPDGPVILPGNVSAMNISNELISNKFGWIYGFGFNCNFGVINDFGGQGFNNIDFMTIHINDVSDDICVESSAIMGAEDGFYVTTMKTVTGIDSDFEGVFEQNYNVSFEEKYIPSSLSHSTIDGYEPHFNIFNSYVRPDGIVSKGYYPVSSPVCRLYCAGMDNSATLRDCFFNIEYSDYATPWYDEDTGEEIGTMTYYTKFQGVTFDEDGNPFRTFSHLVGQFSNLPEGDTRKVAWQHPAFNHKISDVGNQNGDSQPTVAIMSYTEYDWETEGRLWYIDYLPFGRCGEFRVSDMLTANVSDNELEDGRLELSVEISNNVVDGIKGVTSTVSRFNPDEDIQPPMVQQLQFRNSEGLVTDRFAGEDNMIVRLAAADYTQMLSEESVWEWWYENENVDVTFEYSPIGENAWEELSMEEIPEWYVREFGYLYEGKIDNVAEALKAGWYDVRISLRDSQGSEHLQTVSPAFKVEGTDKVESVVTDNRLVVNGDRITSTEGNAVIAVYDFNGTMMMQGVGNLNISELPQGYYVVKAIFGDCTKALKIVK